MAKQFDLRKFALQALEPFKTTSVVEWAEKNVVLSERITEQAGLYSTTSYPYVREVLESFIDPKVRNISLCWGSQTSKTTTIYVGVGYCVDQKPSPILMVYPTDSVVKSFSQDRLIPFFSETKCLLDRMPKTSEGKIDTDKISTHRLEFDRCSINLVGGGSRANVRNYPVSILVLDEIDIISESSRREALDRVKGRRNYKVIQASTPLEETTGIWGEYNAGDMRKYLMPCPHCLNRISFEWKVGDKFCIRYDRERGRTAEGYNLPEVMATTFYYCQNCDKPINDKQKQTMMAQGEWEPQSTSIRHHSYHLNSMYSPTLTFSDIMVKWIQAHDNVDGIRNFVQGWLAQPWKDEILNVSVEKIQELEGDYERGTIKGDIRIMSVDVQRSHYYYIVRGFDRDGTSYLIDHAMVPTFEDLDTAFQTYKCQYGVIDTGYGDRAQEIYEQLYLRRRNWTGVKGWATMSVPYKVNLIDPFTGTGKQGKHKIKLIHLDVTVWQGELGARRAGKTKGWKLYKDPDLMYLRQLSAKWQYESVNRKGEVKVEWRKKSGAGDHYWDCETYCLAFSKLVGFGRVHDPKRPDAPLPPTEPESKQNEKRPSIRRPQQKSIW
jgi:phage terminase large subunit GpA-like protein